MMRSSTSVTHSQPRSGEKKLAKGEGEETMTLKLKDKTRPRVSWTADTVDNEGMNKKKSNRKNGISQCAASTIDLARSPVIPARATMKETPSKGIGTPSTYTRRSVPR